MLTIAKGTPRQRIIYPPISITLIGQVTGVVAQERPVCASCGGELDLSQPDIHDFMPPDLIGLCNECFRLCLVVEMSLTMRVAWALPRRLDAAALMHPSLYGC